MKYRGSVMFIKPFKLH